MINFETNELLSLKKNTIECFNQIEKKIWNLDKLVSIITIDSIKDDEKRKRIIADSKKGTHLVSGGVVGGSIDYMIGDGDSIVEGVILGALFGSLISKETRPEDPQANIVLLFIDNTSLALTVNKIEYSKLQAKAIKNHANIGDLESNSPSFEILKRTRIKSKYQNLIHLKLILILIFSIYIMTTGPDSLFIKLNLMAPENGVDGFPYVIPSEINNQTTASQFLLLFGSYVVYLVGLLNAFLYVSRKYKTFRKEGMAFYQWTDDYYSKDQINHKGVNYDT